MQTHPSIPLPQFREKKGGDSNDLKVEDYFIICNIADKGAQQN